MKHIIFCIAGILITSSSYAETIIARPLALFYEYGNIPTHKKAIPVRGKTNMHRLIQVGDRCLHEKTNLMTGVVENQFLSCADGRGRFVFHTSIEGIKRGDDRYSIVVADQGDGNCILQNIDTWAGNTKTESFKCPTVQNHAYPSDDQRTHDLVPVH